jgi:hypothetical protein
MNWQLFPIEMFDKYRLDWDELNSSNSGTPLLDSRFVSALIEQFGTGDEKLVIGISDVGSCCMAIITKASLGVWHTFQPSQAPIGCWVQEAGMPIELLGASLLKVLPGFSLVLGITQQDPGLLPRPQSSGQAETIDYITTARVPVAGSFENFWSKRGKNLRQNLRRQRNRLNREEVEIDLLTIAEPQLMYDMVKQYGDLESAGWKSESNTAIHIDNSQGRFYAKILKEFAATNQAIVFQYHYDNKLVATDLCIIGGGCLIILKTTYDESITTSSPAMLMREESFNYIFSRNLVDKIEFYGKLMEWHKKWADDIRDMYHINFYSKIGSKSKVLRGRAKPVID